MYIEGEMYFKYGKSYILLCKNITITPALLEKFYQTKWGNHKLYIEERYFDDILALSEQFKQLQEELGGDKHVFEKPPKETVSGIIDLTAKINLHSDYKDLRDRLYSVMDTATKENRVSLEVTESLAEDVNRKIELTDPALLIECINTLRDPDDYLNAHAANVAMLNGMIGTWLRLPPDDIDALIKTGLLHDLGKLRISPEILNKPGELDEAEFTKIKKHTLFSYEILQFSGETDNRILEGVLSHHEKLNGTGYPNGIKLDQLSLFARVTAVSDVYDAMVAKRPYKDRNSPFKILAEFALHKFSHLDISIVNIFLEKMPAALAGKNVLLSDGRIAKIVYINPHNFTYPIVEIEGNLISTSPDLECVSMENFLAEA